jgi:hypothetical protein
LILEKIPKEEAWENCEETGPDCYIVHWQKEDKSCLMYEDEIMSVI